jgi:hypothetical protein
MSTRQTIALNYEGNQFAFYVEANIMEKQEINQVAAELLGGLENYSKLIAIADNAYFNHQKHCRAKFGFEGFIQKERELIELSKDEEKKNEWDQLYQEVYGNQFYLQFLNLTKEQTKIEKYASVIVLCCEKPKDFDFKKQDESFMKGLVKEVETKLKFFREQTKEAEEVNKT